MPIIDTIKTNLKNLFKRESFNSNIGFVKRNQRNKFSLKKSSECITYTKGCEILQDTQVSTGYDILKYLLSSKQWVLVANENDTDNEIYDFINNMLFNMKTELNEIVKQQVTAVPWGIVYMK